jgi:hypothetical protein
MTHDPSVVFIIFRVVIDLFWLASSLWHSAAAAMIFVLK